MQSRRWELSQFNPFTGAQLRQTQLGRHFLCRLNGQHHGYLIHRVSTSCPLGIKKYSRSWMFSAYAVREALEILVLRNRQPNVRIAGAPPWTRELAETCFFLSLGCQGISSSTVDLIVTMRSYRALVRFLNSLRTRM